MVQIATLLAAAAALAGVQAQGASCPPSGQFCGSEIINVLQCSSVEHLESLVPAGSGPWRTWVFETDPTGYVWRPVTDCVARGCANSTPNTPAHCFA